MGAKGGGVGVGVWMARPHTGPIDGAPGPSWAKEENGLGAGNGESAFCAIFILFMNIDALLKARLGAGEERDGLADSNSKCSAKSGVQAGRWFPWRGP